MPKFILYLIPSLKRGIKLCLFFMLLILPTTVSAEASVKINSNVSSNQSSSASFKNETHIRVESDGEVKEYHGSDPDVHIESSNGKSSVTVNNNDATNNPSPSSTSKVTSKTNITVNSTTSDSSASPSSTPEATVAGVFKDNTKSKHAGLWEYFKKQLEAFFSFFS